jgi:hypothetical protein
MDAAQQAVFERLVGQTVAAQVAAQVAQMRHELAAEHAQQLAAARTGPQPAGGPFPAGVVSAARPPQAKLHENARYGGSAALDPWLATMRQYAEYYELPDGEQRVAYAAAHLKDAALQWWQTVTSRPTTWAAFVEALRARFQPVTSAEMARAKLRVLSQGRGSVQAYVATFNALMAHVPTMSEDDRVFAFVQGLSGPVQSHVDEVAHSTLASAIERAVRFGSRHARTQVTSGGTGGSPMELDVLGIEGLESGDTGDAPSDSSTPAAPNAAPEQPVTRSELQLLLAALVDGRRSGGSNGGNGGVHGGGRRQPQRPRGPPVIPHLSPEQVRAYMDAGKCFGCGSTDHRSRQCPKRKVGPDGRPSWSN